MISQVDPTAGTNAMEAVGDEIKMRTTLRPGDLGRIVELHGELYAREFGWGRAFEAYVAESLGAFVLRGDPATDRFWLAEIGDRLVGSIAIGGRPGPSGQLRYFLVDPRVRGRGLGKRLLEEALAFCREREFRSVFLWTASDLPAAAHLYLTAGFRLVEEVPEPGWGHAVVRHRYELDLERF
jgi:N-acetylglutamate synthase-like GNAT family acetyltransferase